MSCGQARNRLASSKSIPRASACDVRLADVEDRAFRLLQVNRQRYGGFPLLAQMVIGEFLPTVDDADHRTVGGVILPQPMLALTTGP